MAKRKRKPGGGSKLKPIKDYRSDEYIPYIFKAEVGILEAWKMVPDLRDGDVRQALRNLIKAMKRTDQLPPELTGSPEKSTQSLLERRILDQLSDIFQEETALSVEDTIGVLTEVNHSVGAWNRGMLGQEYLKYIDGFLGDVGVEVRQLTDEEAQHLELPLSSDSIEGDYNEI